ncbi:MAG: glycerophosphodiester phosphodiesterase [Candidatus Thorarchaeota archaeon]
MDTKSSFLYIGHRGTRTIYDENTIKAFKKAINFGANYIEFDVRKTRDGEIIVLHDSTLDRTTTGSGRLINYTYKELKKFRTKSQSYMIPRLFEVFEILRGKSQFVIEIKENNLTDEILNIANKHDLLNNCIFSGRSLKELERIKLRYPQVEICYNITKGLGYKIHDFLKYGKAKKLEMKPNLINLRSNLITKEFIEVCKINNIKSLAWDFLNYKNPISQIKACIKAGINGILFDDHRNIPIIKHWVDSS